MAHYGSLALCPPSFPEAKGFLQLNSLTGDLILCTNHPGQSPITKNTNSKLHVTKDRHTSVQFGTLGSDLVPHNQAHQGSVFVKPPPMSSALATKLPAALRQAAIVPFASRAGHARQIHVSRPSTNHQHHLSGPIAATQIRHLGSDSKSQPQASATASGKADSTKKEGRQSVLDRMGANRTTKIVIIVFLSIYGTMETIFYVNAAYRYFSKEESE